MRMWLHADPARLCHQHLLGEHRELHGLCRKPAAWSQARWLAKIRGHLRLRQIEPLAIVQRHADLVAECERRGWPSGADHRSPLAWADVAASLDGLTESELSTTVDRDAGRRALHDRCPACRALEMG